LIKEFQIKLASLLSIAYVVGHTDIIVITILLSKSVKIKIHRTIILPVASYTCETWSLTWRDKCRLRVFENMVLRRIFGPERDDITGEWRTVHNKELYALYSSQNIWVIKSRRLRWAGHVARMGERRGACRALVG
jgi:hypothetical protein